MKDFNYYAPTEVVFGEQSEEQVAALVKKYGGTKVLVHYGGQSAVRSGLLDKICGLLKAGGVDYVTLGGVVPNPRLSLAQKGIELCRKEGVDFILAVGGGSVIDSAKCIAYGVPYEGNVWDFYLGKAKATAMLPSSSAHSAFSRPSHSLSAIGRSMPLIFSKVSSSHATESTALPFTKNLS